MEYVIQLREVLPHIKPELLTADDQDAMLQVVHQAMRLAAYPAA